MDLNIIGGAYSGRSLNLNSQECENLFVIQDKEGGRPLALVNTPGLVDLGVSGLPSGEVRGMNLHGDALIVVIAQYVVSISSALVATAISGVLLTTTGKVWVESNGTQAMIVDGVYGYIIAGTTLTRITDADFVTPSSLAYNGGYFVVSEASSGRFWISEYYDGTLWDALDFATAEADPDNLLCVASKEGTLFLMGKLSYEAWYNSGETFPFTAYQGSYNRIGLGAIGSVAEESGILFFLDNNRQVRMIAEGFESQKVSTEQIDYVIQGYSTISDARGFVYTQEGHTFYVLNFPAEDKTWVFDKTMTLWHKRSSDSGTDRHPVQNHIFFSGKNVVGAHTGGKLYYYSLGTYTDSGSTLRRIRSTAPIIAELKNTFHSQLTLEMEAGVGGSWLLQWSDDGGHTWNTGRSQSMGAAADYGARVIWRRLGKSRNRIYRLSTDDAVKIAVSGAYLEIDGGVS